MSDRYVYVVRVDGVVRYIGRGTGARYLHTNSGMSSCYKLNRDHFNGCEITTDVTWEKDLCGSSSEDIEKELIENLEGLYNRTYNRSHSHTDTFLSEGSQRALGDVDYSPANADVEYVKGLPFDLYLNIAECLVFEDDPLDETISNCLSIFEYDSTVYTEQEHKACGRASEICKRLYQYKNFQAIIKSEPIFKWFLESSTTPKMLFRRILKVLDRVEDDHLAKLENKLLKFESRKWETKVDILEVRRSLDQMNFDIRVEQLTRAATKP